MRGTRPRGYVRKAELKIWIFEQQREDLTLLLRAHDGQQRRRWSSIHEMNNTLHFVDTTKPIAARAGALVAAASRQTRDGTLAALTFARVRSLTIVRREVCGVPERRWRLTFRGWPRWRVPMPRVSLFRRARPEGSSW